MACLAPKLLRTAGGGQFRLIPPGTILPGQDVPVHELYAGFGGLKSRGLHAGQIVSVDCRTCPSCIVKYQNALIGACLAETAFAENSVRLDMTYANDAGSDTRSDMAHKMLTPSHLREFTERMRMARGFGRMRYLIAGEYGPLLGRAHWHAVLIFEDGMPDFDFSAERYNDNRIWPYGFIRARPCDSEAGFAYAVKYAVKSTKAMQDNPNYLPGVETVMRRSRIPPLGEPFFIERAVQSADFGVPLSMRYMPPGGIRAANYHVRGKATRLRMAHAYLERLDEAGYDTSFIGPPPRGYVPAGPAVPLSADPDIVRLLGQAVRERHLATLPDMTPEQETAALTEKYAEREAIQQRLNKRDAELRHERAVQRARERSARFFMETRDDPDDPVWLEYPEGRLAFDMAKSGRW